MEVFKWIIKLNSYTTYNRANANELIDDNTLSIQYDSLNASGNFCGNSLDSKWKMQIFEFLKTCLKYGELSKERYKTIENWENQISNDKKMIVLQDLECLESTSKTLYKVNYIFSIPSMLWSLDLLMKNELLRVSSHELYLMISELFTFDTIETCSLPLYYGRKTMENRQRVHSDRELEIGKLTLNRMQY